MQGESWGISTVHAAPRHSQPHQPWPRFSAAPGEALAHPSNAKAQPKRGIVAVNSNGVGRRTGTWFTAVQAAEPELLDPEPGLVHQ